MYHEYLVNAPAPKRAVFQAVVGRVRQWDYLAAQRPDMFAADSDFVAGRIEKFYGRKAATVYPGTIENPNPIIDDPAGYYLVVSRFVRYKRVDLAIEACNLLGRELVVIGSGGEEEESLKAVAGPTVRFVGSVDDGEMQMYYSCARAFLFPGIEDYGITPVEAMSAGCPVLAYGAGGALETVEDGKTGLYFREQTPEALAACIEAFERDGVAYSRGLIREHARNFSTERFNERMKGLIEEGLVRKGLVA